MIRTVTAAILILAAGVLVPIASGGKADYTAVCSKARDVTVTWPGGTDIAGTKALLDWSDGTEQSVNLALPKKGGLHTYTWHNVGSQTGTLLGVEVQFVRNNSFFPPPVTAFCS